MGNHLTGQSSPYLLQHAENPVDWYPWGEEAFRKAAREDKPVFLSIGYSTCHWCHVMERESFENREVAEILNRYFVSVKVDREERPDVDSVYMSVCQALTGSGGWPLSILLTPDRKPFFAGTYFPPVSRHGMMGLCELLRRAADRWGKDREELMQSAASILSEINVPGGRAEGKIDGSLPKRAAEMFAAGFDKRYGGFGSAPKFPTPHNLLFLLLYSQAGSLEKSERIWDFFREGQKKGRDSGEGKRGREAALEQVRVTLEQMRRGGIFDQIGFGFSRYSTDRYYLVPHFEKMLYDNALLILAYAAAYKVYGNDVFLDTAEKTAAYVFREMTGEHGEFYSAQDADSNGEEGRFYVWSYREVCQVLGEEKGRRFCSSFGMTQEGNFEGRNIPNLLHGSGIPEQFEEERELLYAYRKSRCSLHLDDKVLTAWNSLMICALSMLYRVTGNEKYLWAAERAQQFIENRLVCGDILYAGCRGHACSVKGFLDDYAYYCAALLGLYGATGRTDYLERAEQVCRESGRQFADGEYGGYFLYGAENEGLIMRPKETYDGALPSGNSVMAYCLVQLRRFTEKEEYERLAERQFAFLSGEAADYPAGHAMFLIALLMHFYPPQKITVVFPEAVSEGEPETIPEGESGAAVPFEREAEPEGESGAAVSFEREREPEGEPGATLSGEPETDGREGQWGHAENGNMQGTGSILRMLPLYADVRILQRETEEYKAINGKTTYYVCRDHACLPPSNGIPMTPKV